MRPIHLAPTPEAQLLILSVIEQTNLAGKVQTEINCLPVENPEYQQYMERSNAKLDDAKPKLQFIKNELVATNKNPVNVESFTVRHASWWDTHQC